MAIVVETGEGLSNSEAYIDVVMAEEIFDLYGYPEGWTDLNVDDKEKKIRRAARYIDLSMSFLGEPFKTDQALAFPRTDFVNSSGSLIEGGTIPTLLKEANAYLAGVDITHDLNKVEQTLIESESYMSTSVTYAGSVTEGAYSEVKPILKWLSRFGVPQSSFIKIMRA